MRVLFVRFLSRVLIAVLAAAAGSSSGAVTAVDDRGERVVLAVPAQRIVALAPSITELVFAAGAGDRLVAVARYSDFPPQAGTIAQIGDASRIDIERVISLKPDLVIAWKTGNHAGDYERLKRLGFAVFIAEPDRLQAIGRLVRTIGTLAGTGEAAGQTAEIFERAIESLAGQYRERPAVPVFYEIWHSPLMTVNGRHLISDVIALCGGRNVFGGVPALTPVVSLESVIAARPAVVLGGSSATSPDEFAAAWQRDSRFEALRKLRAIYVDPDLIQRQSPRVLDGARAVCAQLERVRAGN